MAKKADKTNSTSKTSPAELALRTTEAKLKLLEAQAGIKKIELDVELAKVVPRQSVISDAKKTATLVSKALNRLPTRLAPSLVGIDDAAVIAGILKKELSLVLAELKRSVFTGTGGKDE